MDLKRPSHQLYNGQCRAWQSCFLNIVGCCNFTEVKSHEVCTVYGIFLKNRMSSATKCSIWPSNMLKTVDLEYHSSLSVAWIVRFWFRSLQNSTIHKRPLVQGNLFLLAVYTHEVPLCLCSIFCSRSQVRMSTVSYCIWSADYAPFCIL